MTERLRSRDMGTGTFARSQLTPISVTMQQNSEVGDMHVFIADQRYRVVSVKARWTANSTSGTLQVRRCQGTEAPSAGDALLSSTVDLSTGANSTQTGSLITTDATLVLEDGDRLALDFGGTLTSLTGLNVTILLLPLDGKEYYQSP